MNEMLAGLSAGLAICRVAVVDNGGLLASLFLTGLIGSLTHCTGMCGPFVLSQVAARMESVPLARMSEWHRLSGAALLPYHLGRATTYAALGAAGAAAAGLVGGGGFRLVAAALLVLAALFLLGMAVPRLKRLLSGEVSGESWWSRTIGQRARPLFANPTGLRGYGLGLMLGFIPCGLLYAALAAASASGDALAGALAMAAFAAGTVPALFAIGVIGHFAIGRWRAPVLKWAPLLLVVNALMLGLMAWQMVA